MPQIEYCFIISVVGNLVGVRRGAAFVKHESQCFFLIRRALCLLCINANEEDIVRASTWPAFFIMHFFPTLCAGKSEVDETLNTSSCLQLSIISDFSAFAGSRTQSIKAHSGMKTEKWPPCKTSWKVFLSQDPSVICRYLNLP